MSDNVAINGVTLTRDALEENIKHYLGAKHISLWADWCITQEDSMNRAASWFATQICELAELIPTNGNGNGQTPKRKGT